MRFFSRRKSMNSEVVKAATKTKVVSSKIQRSKSLSSFNKVSKTSPKFDLSPSTPGRTTKSMCKSSAKKSNARSSLETLSTNINVKENRHGTPQFAEGDSTIKLSSTSKKTNNVVKSPSASTLNQSMKNSSLISLSGNVINTPFLKTKSPNRSKHGGDFPLQKTIESPSSTIKTSTRSLKQLQSPSVDSPNKLNNNSPLNTTPPNKLINISTTPLKTKTPKQSNCSVNKSFTPRISISSSKITKSVRLRRSSTPMKTTPEISPKNKRKNTPKGRSSKMNIDINSRLSLSPTKIVSPETTGNIATEISNISGVFTTSPMSQETLLTPKSPTTQSVSPKCSSVKSPKGKFSDKPNTRYSSPDLSLKSTPVHSQNKSLVISIFDIKSPRRSALKASEKNKSSSKKSQSLISELSNLSNTVTPNKKIGLNSVQKSKGSSLLVEEYSLLVTTDSTDTSLEDQLLNQTNLEPNDNLDLTKNLVEKKLLNFSDVLGSSSSTDKTPTKSLRNRSLSQNTPGSTRRIESTIQSPRTRHSKSFQNTISPTKPSVSDLSLNDSSDINNIEVKAYVHNRSSARKNSLTNKLSLILAQDSTPKTKRDILREPNSSFSKLPSTVIDDNSPANIKQSVTPKLKSEQHNKLSTFKKSLDIGSAESGEIAENAVLVTDSKRRSTRRSALRNSISSSNTTVTSDCKPELPSSSIKTIDVVKLNKGVKRKISDFEARAERAAKQLKMETPKSLSK